MGLEWLTSEERRYYQSVLLTLAKTETPKDLGVLLRKAGLPSQLVRDIVEMVDRLPVLERAFTALKYVALAQARMPLKTGNLRQKVNLPRFEGVLYPQKEQEEDGFGEFQEPVGASNAKEGRTRYLDEAMEDSSSKHGVSMKQLQSKVMSSEEDMPSPSEVEEEKQPKSTYQDTDLLDFTEVPATFGKSVAASASVSAQPDLLSSDFFMPAPKNSLARSGTKAFVFPADSKPNPKSQATAVANRLPAFPTQPHRSQSTVEKPLSAKDVLENEAELSKLKSRLIQFMRLEEAEECQAHMELLARVKQLYVQKKEALIRDIADDANDYRRIILNLKEQMAKERDVARWMQPIAENRVTALYRELQVQVSDEAVRILKREYHLDSLQPEKDIHSALVLVQEAFAVAETWLAVGAQQEEYRELAKSVLLSCKEELGKAVRILPKLRQHIHLAVQDPNYETYIRAIPVVYQVADRVSLSVRHLSQLYGDYQSLITAADAIAAQWRQCESHLSVKKEAAKVKTQTLCGLCLCPGAELSHEGAMYHPACVNWWVVRVGPLPAFKAQK